MFKSKLLILIAASLFALNSCSDDTTSPEGMANVQVHSEMSSSVVTESDASSSIAASHIDSIKVTNFRVLISRIKLHKSDKNEDEDNELKVGPFILQADSNGEGKLITESTVPIGDYDKIKFEIHKFDSDEREDYHDDPVFEDFATNEKLTVIIHGNYYRDGEETSFKFSSSIVENIMLKFEPSITLDEDTENHLVIRFNPELLFVENMTLLEPNNNNHKLLETKLKFAFKALKK